MNENTPEDENELVVTRDGSHTVYSSQFDQHYHNPNGAVAESRYVFFQQPGLLDALKGNDEITILEIGFGTGLNLMLLLDYYLSAESTSQINYYSIEGFPLKAETAKSLNYHKHLENPQVGKKILNIFGNLDKGMNRFSPLDNITAHLFNGMFSDFPDTPIGAEYIFHDAFSPDTNPDLWTGQVFKKIREISKDEVILSTYCAASKVQGAMAWAGWNIAKTQGALGKREMILGALNPSKLEGLKRVNEERYARRYEEGDFN
ncbi:tRNA (5-methylaminomethyl-2-thiouridine)(34)-methyltransferase MnmD [Fodinibius halophilus]|uniref:tRNA (5-methylaminomethyl-2-thiouridine)(34)-methyltransferase MnmD n=1 Tax=Fodinibius halophilus TaxID=1736908 RepID=A0A6M1T619_9BACT|nr:tRNA (5-methylaminomethyl-2-thiouridine)(34)-methyltransferase MnmD [Fodinibius halophilus]NGP89529.1 tRNA (5-methylaminomethyl-2-thiouridine)(34)-methyltransferase MnmD [Fodinibius halophilus]